MNNINNYNTITNDFGNLNCNFCSLCLDSYLLSGLPMQGGLNPELQQFKYNGFEFETQHGINWYDANARPYMADLVRTPTLDLLCELSYSWSPYSWCKNNLINRIDPIGLTDFTFNWKTGEIKQFGETNDDPDRILRTNGKGEVKYNKQGEAKVEIDNIEKGILSDGMNFMENNYIFEVGGEGQPSVDGVETFAVKMSDYIGREIGGAYFSKDGANSITHITIGAYKNNSYKETKGHGHTAYFREFLGANHNDMTGYFHTHPSGNNINLSDRTQPSEQDKRSRDKLIKQIPHLQFFILTHPENYGGKFPNKIPYTNWR